MSSVDFRIADLSEENMDKLKKLERELARDTDHQIALIAYESEKEFSPAELSRDEEKKLEEMEQEFGGNRDSDVAVVVYESK